MLLVPGEKRLLDIVESQEALTSASGQKAKVRPTKAVFELPESSIGLRVPRRTISAVRRGLARRR
jgi:hypothetical protein